MFYVKGVFLREVPAGTHEVKFFHNKYEEPYDIQTILSA